MGAKEREGAPAGVQPLLTRRRAPGRFLKEPSGSYPLSCHRYTDSTAFSEPPAKPEGGAPPALLARLDSPAGQVLQFLVAETTRLQAPYGQEVLHHLLHFTSAREGQARNL